VVLKNFSGRDPSKSRQFRKFDIPFALDSVSSNYHSTN